MAQLQAQQMQDGIYEVKKGQIKPVSKPTTGFGKQIITWENGRVTKKEISFTEK